MAQSSFIIRLGVKDAETVKRALEGLGTDGQKALNRIKSATDKSSEGFRKFNATTALTSRAIAGLTATLASFAAALSVRALIEYSDQWTQINNRLRLVTASSTELVAVQKDLFDIAQESRVGFSDLAELYARVARASKELGASQQQITAFSEGVAKALSTTGVSAEQARGSLLQLGQAIGSGTVRAEEYNSILEGTPRIAQAVADGLLEAGGSVSTLKNLIIAGDVASRSFFEAFLTQLPVLRDEAKTTNTTIGQAFTVLSNSLTKSVGEFNDASDASTKFADALKGVAGGISGASEKLSRGISLLREWKNAALDALHNLPATIYRATGGEAFVTGSGFAGSPEQGGRRPGQRALPPVSLAGSAPTGFDPEKIKATLTKAQEEAKRFSDRTTEAYLQATNQQIELIEKRKDADLAALETVALSEKDKADQRVKIIETANARIAEARANSARATAKASTTRGGAPVGAALGSFRAAQEQGLQEGQDLAKQVADANAYINRLREASLEANGEIIKVIKLRRDRDIAALKQVGLTAKQEAEARVLIEQQASADIATANRQAHDEIVRQYAQLSSVALGTFADIAREGKVTAEIILRAFERMAQQVALSLSSQQGGSQGGGLFGSISAFFRSGPGAAGGSSGGAYAGGSGPAPGSYRAAQTVHTGGIIGFDSLPMKRANFASAPRLHDGLMPGEYPAILQRGEGVFTQRQMAAMGRSTVNVVVNNNAPVDVRTRQTGDNNVTIDIDAAIADNLSRSGTRANRATRAIVRDERSRY